MKISSKKVMLGIAALLVLLIAVTLFFPPSKLAMDSVGGNDIIGSLKDGDVLEEEFITKRGYSSLGIPFANYSQLIDKGYVLVTIKQDRYRPKKYKVKLANIMDNEYYFFKYRFRKNKKYTLTIEIKDANYPMAIYKTNKAKNAALKINGISSKDSIRLAFLYKDKDYFNIWYYVVLLSIVSLCFVMFKDGAVHGKK
ncbi:MAG: hypothetical protein IJH18_03785 [Bacilli bacterium]|nr:hypothetical protein [Bacilli bacterium]